jgi:hypothetical protein
MSLGYEFAPIDVSIITHRRLAQVEKSARLGAFGLWCWGQCYARTHKTAGLLDRAAVLCALAAPERDIERFASELVRVGLWLARDDGDFDVHNFEKKTSRNSTERVRKYREKMRQPQPDVTPDETLSRVSETPPETGGETSPSISPSISVSVSSSQRGEPERGPPQWFADVVEAIHADTGERFAVPEAWIRYSGHRTTVGKAINPQDARYWLGTVMVPEARKERMAASDRRLNQQRRDGPPPPPKQSREEARREAQAFAAQLAARNKGAA